MGAARNVSILLRNYSAALKLKAACELARHIISIIMGMIPFVWE